MLQATQSDVYPISLYYTVWQKAGTSEIIAWIPQYVGSVLLGFQFFYSLFQFLQFIITTARSTIYERNSADEYWTVMSRRRRRRINYVSGDML